MDIRTNFKPDLTTWETKAERREYAKKKCRNKRELMAFLIDLNRYPKGMIFYPWESSGSVCLRRYYTKENERRKACGYRKISHVEFSQMDPKPLVVGWDYSKGWIWTYKKKLAKKKNRDNLF